MEKAPESSAGRDVLTAVWINFIALIVGYPLAMVAPTFLIIILPFGVFWVYLLLVGLYAFFQFRKGRTRRAILVGSFAAIVLVVLAMNTRIA
jgi:hypothetical protein